jgi:hypothetical protein
MVLIPPIAISLGNTILLPNDKFGFEPALSTGAELNRPRKPSFLDQLINLSSFKTAELRQIGKPNNSI